MPAMTVASASMVFTAVTPKSNLFVVSKETDVEAEGADEKKTRRINRRVLVMCA